MFAQRDAERGHVPRRRELRRVRQAVRVAEDRARHAELRALAVIMRAKPASEPPRFSASAVEASFADFVTSE